MVQTSTEKEIMNKELPYLPDAGQIEGMIQRHEQQQTRQGKHKLNSTCTSAKKTVTECTYVHSNSIRAEAISSTSVRLPNIHRRRALHPFRTIRFHTLFVLAARLAKQL